MAQIRAWLPYADRPAGKKQVEWYPIKGTLNADGSVSIVVDTELTINGATLNIDNLFVASTDGTPANAKYIKIESDGTVHVVASVGVPKHYNGNANIIEATVTFAGTTKSVLIQNMHASNDVYISFDNGVSWKTIKQLDNVSLECSISSLKIKASVDATPYEILTTE